MEAAKVTPSGVVFGSTAAAGASASREAAATTIAIGRSDRRRAGVGGCSKQAKRPAMAKRPLATNTVVRPMPIQPRSGRAITL